jgi:hypothetical protein
METIHKLKKIKCCEYAPGPTYMNEPNQGILNREVSLYHWPTVWLVWNQLYENWQFLFLFAKQTIKTSQTGGQQYSDTSPFRIPWPDKLVLHYSRL